MRLVTVWEVLEHGDCLGAVSAVLDAYSWGLNCDPEGNPFLLFCDLSGLSREDFGSPFVLDSFDGLGFMEASYLGKCLDAWSESPYECESLARLLLELDAEGEGLDVAAIGERFGWVGYRLADALGVELDAESVGVPLGAVVDELSGGLS